MESGNRAAGDGDKHEGPDRGSLRVHVVEVRPDLRDRVGRIRHDTEDNTDSHRDQADTEDRVDTSDDGIDRDEGGDEVVQQDDGEPEGTVRQQSGAGACRIDHLDDQAGRALRKYGTDHDEENDREYTHDVLHSTTEIITSDLRDRATVASLGKHTGKVIMDTTGEDGTTGDPQENNRAPECTLQGTEDRAEAGDVQKLNQEQLPLWHDDVIDAIIDSDGRCFTVIRSEGAVDELTIGKIAGDECDQT